MLSTAVPNHTLEIKIMDFACQTVVLPHKSAFALFTQVKKLRARRQTYERCINSWVGSGYSPDMQTSMSMCDDAMMLFGS